MVSKMCTNDLRSYSRLWLTEFIEIYRKEECLWQGKHNDYSNHAIRNTSYDKLVEKLKEVEPNPDRAMVVRKINSLRSAFRREFRKRMTKENYETRLWYFDKLMFIADQNPKRMYEGQKRELKICFEDDTIDFEEQDESDRNEAIQSEERIATVPEPIRCHVVKSENNICDNTPQQPLVQQQQQQQQQQQPQQSALKVLDITSLDVNSQREIQKAVDSLEQQHQQQVQQQMQHTHHQSQHPQVTQIHHQQVPTIQISREHLPTLFNSTLPFDTPAPRHNDEFDAIGLNVASKLRVMNHTQRIIAEKLISDILFNGQLDNLNISSNLTNCLSIR